MESRNVYTGPSFWVSLTFILIGVLFLLDNLGMIYLDQWWDFWPLILIAIGLGKLLGSRFKDIYASGILLVLGLLFLALEMNFLYWEDVLEFWPVILIIIGIKILINQQNRLKRPGHRESRFAENRLDAVAIFGGKEVRVSTDQFEGGNITAVFGGADVYFENARLSAGKNILDVFVMFGGAEIYVPSDWKVVLKGFPIFGGISDARKNIRIDHDVADDRTLIVSGFVMFGGIEIKSLA